MQALRNAEVSAADVINAEADNRSIYLTGKTANKTQSPGVGVLDILEAVASAFASVFKK